MTADREVSKGDYGTDASLEELGGERISSTSTRRLEYVLESLYGADELGRELVWQSELWDDCTVEELIGALLEAENLLEWWREELEENA